MEIKSGMYDSVEQNFLETFIIQIDTILRMTNQTTTNKEIAIVVGNEGVGKSTLVSYLMGAQLEDVPYALNRNVIDIKNPIAANIKYPRIYHTNTEGTLYPSTFETKAGLNLFDSPGFAQFRRENGFIANLCVELAIKCASKIIGIICVIDYNDINSHGRIKSLINALDKLFNQSTKNIRDSICFVIVNKPNLGEQRRLPIDNNAVLTEVNKLIAEDEKVVSQNSYNLSLYERNHLAFRLEILKLINEKINSLIIFDPLARDQIDFIGEKIKSAFVRPIPKDCFKLNYSDEISLIQKCIILITRISINLLQDFSSHQRRLEDMEATLRNHHNSLKFNNDLIINCHKQLQSIDDKNTDRKITNDIIEKLKELPRKTIREKELDNNKRNQEIVLIKSQLKELKWKIGTCRYEIMKIYHVLNPPLSQLLSQLNYHHHAVADYSNYISQLSHIAAIKEFNELRLLYNLEMIQYHHTLHILQVNPFQNIFDQLDLAIAILNEAIKINCIELDLFECPLSNNTFLDFLHPRLCRLNSLKRLVLPRNLVLTQTIFNEIVKAGIEVITNSNSLSALLESNVIICNMELGALKLVSYADLNRYLSRLTPKQRIENTVAKIEQDFSVIKTGSITRIQNAIVLALMKESAEQCILNAYNSVSNNPSLLSLSLIRDLMMCSPSLLIFKFPYSLACIAWNDESFDRSALKDIIYNGLEHAASRCIIAHETLATFKMMYRSARKKGMITEYQSRVLDSKAESSKIFSAPEFTKLKNQYEWCRQELKCHADQIQNNRNNILLLARELLAQKETQTAQAIQIQKVQDQTKSAHVKLNFLAEQVDRNARNISQVADSIVQLKDAMVRQKERALRFSVAKIFLTYVGASAIADALQHINDLSDLEEVAAQLLDIPVTEVSEHISKGVHTLIEGGTVRNVALAGSDALIRLGYNPDEFIELWSKTHLALDSKSRNAPN